MRKWTGSKVMAVAVVLALSVLGGTAAWAADAAAGKDVYGAKCKTCHGADGAGNPGMAKALKVEFKHLGSPEVQKMKDDEFKKIITAGKDKMKPVAGISAADVANVIAFVRTLKK